MALKAGTVGLDPKYVDKNGAPISQEKPVDAYTKAETDTLLEAKADLTSLRANSKTFQFAYSGGNYGYKAGSTGDFHPFEEAGVTSMGWVKPATLTQEGLTAEESIVIDEGGYAVKDGVCYIDIIVHNTVQKTASTISAISGLPGVDKTSGSATIVMCGVGNTTKSVAEKYYNKTCFGARITQGTSATSASLSYLPASNGGSATVAANTYMHMWGQYDILTT